MKKHLLRIFRFRTFLTPVILCFILTGYSSAWSQALKDPIKIQTEFGGKFAKCSNSPENYYVIYKNTNPFPIDLVIAVKDISGEWKVFQKNNMATNDTLLAFTCTGAGKAQMDFRKSGDQLPLMNYDELNKEYLRAHPRLNTDDPKTFIDLRAKLLYGEKTKKPLVNQKVDLKDDKGAVLHSTVTNEFGDFTFNKVNTKQGITLSLENNATLPKDEKVYLAKVNGSVVNEMRKDANNNFVYKMLPQDFKKLSTAEVEDDPFLAMKDFTASQVKDLVIADNVYFEAGSSALLPEAKQKLDKVVVILKENPSMRVELSAHTDSNGDDASNLKLSEERASLAVQYIKSKGIDPKKVSGKGFGETLLLNRCSNGINCSEEEHRANRRIEFKFIKI